MIRSPLRLSVLPVGLAALVLAGCGSQAAAKPTSVSQAITPGPAVTATVLPTPVVTGSSAAIVNGHAIPLSAFKLLLTLNQRAGAAQLGKTPNIKTLTKQTMDEVVINELVREYAAKHNITVTAADVSAQQTKDLAQSGGQAAFDKTLAQYGMTLADYRSLIATNLLGAKVEQKVAPIKTTEQKAAHVRHILIAIKPLAKGQKTRTDAQAKALADQIQQQLLHGANFATLAKKYSDDTGSAAQGGDLGKVYPGQTVPPFNHAVFTQALNTPTVVKSQFGYHVIEVLSRGMAPGQPSQADQAKQRTVFLAWVAAQKKQATIKLVAHVQS